MIRKPSRAALRVGLLVWGALLAGSWAQAQVKTIHAPEGAHSWLLDEASGRIFCSVEDAAEVVEYDPEQTTRREVARSLAAEGAYTLIPPFDHPHILAGQGTAALELHAQVPDLDLFLAPVGGGGLMSGCAVATKELAPGCRVVGVEPEVADDATRSFRTGTLHTVSNPPTIADGTRTQSLGRYNFPIFLECVDDMVTVSDEEILQTMRFLWERLKLVVEPTGALGLAAAFCGKVAASGRRVGAIVSGGNVDLGSALELLRGVPET